MFPPPPNRPQGQPDARRPRAAVDFELKNYDKAMYDLKEFGKEVERVKKALADRGFQFAPPVNLPSLPTVPAQSPVRSAAPSGWGTPGPLGGLIRSTKLPSPQDTMPGRAMATASGFVAGNKGGPAGWGNAVKNLPVTITGVTANASRAMGAGRPGDGSNRGISAAPLHALTAAATVATGGILGMVRAGLRNTVEGNMLAAQFTMLSRELAGIFLPVVQALTRRMQALNLWLSKLTIRQQDQLMHAGLAVGGVAAAGALAKPVIGPVVGLLGGAMKAVAGLAPALIGVAGAGGPVTIILGALAAAATAAGVAFATLVAVSEPIRNALGKVFAAFEKVWVALAPVRQALLELAEAVVVPFLEELAQAITDIATDPEVIGFIQDLADRIDGLGVVARGVAEIVREAMAAIVNLRPPDFQGVVNGIIDDALQNAAKRGKKEKPDDPGGHRLPTPVNPGREDAIGAYNRIQDAVTKEGGMTEAEKQTMLLEAIKKAQDALLLQQQQQALQQQFGQRPANNGRPG
ncbi:hypothetical protein [Limnoglobus roseus]|uniref:Uncharacterized protein n=1 Tax=Limnoglobus roseus TaxID=2598579 RepID=A0A5C1ADX8_9BACT|nr:hypothetical protein [Limnoglobus roseus]QEL17441.1 hypothetical protein PX52LOC_04430 [Limnoglobus roseus]